VEATVLDILQESVSAGKVRAASKSLGTNLSHPDRKLSARVPRRKHSRGRCNERKFLYARSY
jgi:hypothetical protein